MSQQAVCPQTPAEGLTAMTSVAANSACCGPGGPGYGPVVLNHKAHSEDIESWD